MGCRSPEGKSGSGIIHGPANVRVYGLLLRGGNVLVAEEQLAGRIVLKYPGGGVEANETPEAALIREFAEECQISVRPLRLLHAPGTLFSPWTHTDYTPIYYLVTGEGNPVVPDSEDLILRFMSPDMLEASGRVAAPELVALTRALNHEK